MRNLAILWCAALVACDPPDEVGPVTVTTEDSARDFPSLEKIEGEWRVVSIDGTSLPERLADGEVPRLTLAGDRASGDLGCNSFGAFSLYADGRFATHSWSSTAMYCEGVSELEQVLSELFLKHPLVRRQGNELTLNSENHSAVLAFRGPTPLTSADPVPQALSGTRWRISFLDRSEEGNNPANRFIEFADNKWNAVASCLTQSGRYRREGGRLMVDDEIAIEEQLCLPQYAALDDAFAALMRSKPRYVIGSNGELIIAGGGHVLTGGLIE